MDLFQYRNTIKTIPEYENTIKINKANEMAMQTFLFKVLCRKVKHGNLIYKMAFKL